MAKAWASRALWVGALLLLVLWTIFSYMGTVNADLRHEILFRYSLIIIFVSLPLGGVTALLIALLTVSFKAIKAAVANPVKSLRTE